ncbi:antichymotrypsin-2 [Culex quinquefasciatus]|uniref:Antichymotrypsin-2 n=1 Tax=Culex quinquefasciatus TaxID=7176 RepID=B0W5Q1_CULQU|nr:antichymotrypsin-2 [Culex quinquefasciatus]|eukprot:XP_001844035.1 antichymotrypsin-2 [Culex quinquefasciatus]
MRFGQNKAEEIQFVSVDKLLLGKQIPRLYINNWVENTTHGEVTDLLIPGSITTNTKLAIANGAYFKSTCQSKFKPEETKKEIFYVSNERQDFVDMMHVEGTFNYAANEKFGCHIPELPYTGQNEASRELIFVFLTPPNPTHWTNSLPALLVNEGISRRVDVKLPKFSIEKTVDMKPVLGQLSMGKLFENSANFTDFSKKAQIGFDCKSPRSPSTRRARRRRPRRSRSASDRCGRSGHVALQPSVHLRHLRQRHAAVLFNGVYRQPE